MARANKKRTDRKRHDPGYSSPPPNVDIATAALGTAASQLALTFAQPMLIVDNTAPKGITAGTAAPTSVTLAPGTMVVPSSTASRP